MSGRLRAGRARLLGCRALNGRFSRNRGHGFVRRAPETRPARRRVRLSGRATAACSPRCDAGGVLSLDWHAPGAEMRIQVDRVFADASGAIASLEITDVLADQAEQYVGVHSNKF